MTNSKQTEQLSKFLSLVLRHKPETIGITLDESGWTDVEILLANLIKVGKIINREILNEVVATNNKKRFAFNNDGSKIRASQGHSVAIDVGYASQQPPEVLYHGSAEKNTESILANGLDKRNRNHVHLSADTVTATTVGSRHGKPIIFIIDSAKMHKNGYRFYLSENNVWLTDAVPPEYIRITK